VGGGVYTPTGAVGVGMWVVCVGGGVAGRQAAGVVHQQRGQWGGVVIVLYQCSLLHLLGFWIDTLLTHWSSLGG